MSEKHLRPLTSVRIEDADGERIEVTLRGVTPEVWDRLVSMHPDPGGALPWDDETFGQALVARCLSAAQPDPTRHGSDLSDLLGLVAQWWQEWPADQVDVLYTACLDASAPGSVDWAVERLRVDDRLAAEMAYCGPNGVPHSVFLTWPRADQDKAVAWQITKDDGCPGCGIATRLMDDPVAGYVDQRRCVHCEAMAAANKAVPDAEQSAIHTAVRAYTPAERRLIDRAIDRGDDVDALLRALRGASTASMKEAPQRTPVAPSMTS